eukprot:123161-Prymnesium_polylepis.1
MPVVRRSPNSFSERLLLHLLEGHTRAEPLSILLIGFHTCLCHAQQLIPRQLLDLLDLCVFWKRRSFAGQRLLLLGAGRAIGLLLLGAGRAIGFPTTAVTRLRVSDASTASASSTDGVSLWPHSSSFKAAAGSTPKRDGGPLGHRFWAPAGQLAQCYARQLARLRLL